MCFGFFVLQTTATIGLQTFMPSALNAGLAVPLVLATTAVTAYLLGGTAGIVAGGFLATRTTRHDLVAAAGLLAAAVLLAIVGTDVLPIAATVPMFVLVGFSIGCTGPSRDLIVRNATPKGAAGRVYGFVYSGLDLGRHASVPSCSATCSITARAARCSIVAALLLVLAVGTVRARRPRMSAGLAGGLTHGPRHRGTPRARLRGQQGTGPRLRGGARARRRRGDDRRAHGRRRRAHRAARSASAPDVPCTHVACDITTPEGRAAALAACPDPDILVNNAGGPPPGDFRDWDRDDVDQGASTRNMLTPIELIKATVDGMIARGFGRIVNITSPSVKAPIDVLGLSNGARSGLTGFVAGAARKLARHGVTINNLLPGSFDTDRLRA